jgi:hypothetical protein
MGFWAGSEKNQAATARAKAKTAQRKANRASNRASNRAANKASNGAANKASKSAPAQQSFLSWLFNGSPKNQAATARQRQASAQRKTYRAARGAAKKANRPAPKPGIPTQEQLAAEIAKGGNLGSFIFGSNAAAEKAKADYRRKHPERVAKVERDFTTADHNNMWGSSTRAAAKSNKPNMPKNREPSTYLFNFDSFRRR